jgi:hypothetical protein
MALATLTRPQKEATGDKTFVCRYPVDYRFAGDGRGDQRYGGMLHSFSYSAPVIELLHPRFCRLHYTSTFRFP